MLPDHVQICSQGAPPAVKDRSGVSNSVPSTAKHGAGHRDFTTSQSQLTASAVTRLCFLKEQEKWERAEFRNMSKNNFLVTCGNYWTRKTS